MGQYWKKPGDQEQRHQTKLKKKAEGFQNNLCTPWNKEEIWTETKRELHWNHEISQQKGINSKGIQLLTDRIVQPLINCLDLDCIHSYNIEGINVEQ